MRFIGSKENLLFFIDHVFDEMGIKGQIFCDLFSGTTKVAQHFKKKGYNIISNDNLRFSYFLQKTYIENNVSPKFIFLNKWLKENNVFDYTVLDEKNVFKFLNSLSGKEGYFYESFSPGGKAKRMYLSKTNASKIDRILNAIEYWKKENLLHNYEEYILRSSLIEAIPYVSNISGTYGAYLKHWDKRALKDIELKIPEYIYSDKEHYSFEKDANDLIKQIESDVLYIDPPYNARSYISNYHLLETVARNDRIQLKGITGIRNDDHLYKSDYNKKEKCKDALHDLISNAKAKVILLSYSSEGIIPEKEIEKILKGRGKNFIKHQEEYKRFRSNSRRISDKNILEYIYYVEIPQKKYLPLDLNLNNKILEVEDKINQFDLFDDNGKSRGKISKGKYGVDIGNRGIYDVRNKLNNLTGKEWVYRTNSVDIIQSNESDSELYRFLKEIWETKYSTNGEEGFSHKLRSKHPSPKPPQLMKRIIEFFSKENEWILDPFMGVGGTLLGASLINRNAMGIDLSKEYIEIYREVCKKENLREQVSVVGNSKNLDHLIDNQSKMFDLIVTDPPYGNMMLRKKTGEAVKKKKSTSPTPFTTNKNDIGNLPLESFLDELKSIIGNSIKFLKKNGYLILFAKDFQPSKEYNGLLHCDIINKITEIDQIRFKGYKIWYDKTVNLYPYGYPYAYISNQLHQFILIFRKEES